MNNAALYLHPNGYDTSGSRLLGRHSAGESFLRGFIRHADVEAFHFYNVAGRPQAELDALVARIQAPQKPINWIGHLNRPALAGPGILNMPVPNLPAEAWRRRPHGERAYGICGITHTTATAAVMDVVSQLLIAPLEPYDALICTSTAVRRSVEAQLDLVRTYLAEQFGAQRRPEPQRVTILLGVNTSDFQVAPKHRKAWRERLDIPEDAVVALYVGRFNVRGKMNPALMAMALERAARASKRPLYWVNSGWAESEKAEAEFHAETQKLCPSVHYRHLDGRKEDVRFSIWSVGDFFISFSDNIQETFGLTPIEAMSAGLPCVVSDWDGYKDTVRHGKDGFRVPTITPRPGLGLDIAYGFENGWINYDNYVGAVAQYTAVDLAEAERGILALVVNDDLRRRMGEAACAQARAIFDWSAIIPQYQALWGEQNSRRLAAGTPKRRRANPMRPDPYAMFADYPSRRLSRQDTLALIPGMTSAAAMQRLDGPLARYSSYNRPSHAEVETVLAFLAGRQAVTVADVLENFPARRRSFIERGLLWFARHDVLVIIPDRNAPPQAPPAG